MDEAARYEALVAAAQRARMLGTAVYWQELLVARLPAPAPDAVLVLADLHSQAGHHRRGLAVLERAHLVAHSPQTRLVAARCQMALGEWENALRVLDDLGARGTDAAWLCVLRARCYSALDNRSSAAQCYREAIRHDMHCAEAVMALADGQMLAEADVHSLLDDVPDRFLRELYAVRFGIALEAKSVVADLGENVDVRLAQAMDHYRHCRFDEALRITRALFSREPERRDRVLEIHLAVLVEMRNTHELFDIAHKAAESAPKSFMAHYAIACYYYALGKHTQARLYFGKCTSLEREHGGAWLGYGHASAHCGESEAALSAYRLADRLLATSQLPPLALGAELARVHHLPLAAHHLQRAHARAPSDPHVLHELGCLAYRRGQWQAAARHFKHALALFEAAQGSCEATVLNLAHALRKLRRYEDAEALYVRAVGDAPDASTRASATSGRALCLHLRGYVDAAIAHYSHALALHADEPTAKDMLPRAYQDFALLPAPAVSDPDWRIQ